MYYGSYEVREFTQMIEYWWGMIQAWIVPLLLPGIIGAWAKWRVYQKMGINGWKSIIPVYSDYLLFKGLYDNGWRILWLWLPLPLTLAANLFGVRVPVWVYIIAGLIVLITWLKLFFDLARGFSLPASFGFGLLLLNPVFMFILGFSGYRFKDGTRAILDDEVIGIAAYKLDNWIRSASKKGEKDAESQKKENDMASLISKPSI